MNHVCLNNRRTQYFYDLNTNRMTSYDVYDESASGGNVVERVENEYADGDAAGNVRRVVRKVPDPVGQVDEWFVFATEFFYNKAAEVQVISQRTWHDALGVVTNLTLLDGIFSVDF